MFPTKFKNIVVLELPLSEKAESVFSLAYHADETLNALIDEIVNEFADKKVECFKRKNNVIATESGYFLAFYEDDIHLALYPDAKRTILAK